MKVDDSTIFVMLALVGTLGLLIWRELAVKLSGATSFNGAPTRRREACRLVKWVAGQAGAFWGYLLNENSMNTSDVIDPSVSNAEVVIVLIHGTRFWWSPRRHAWIRTESTLCRALPEDLSSYKTAFVRLEWPGGNRFKHRFLAALKLRNVIAKIKLANADAKIFLISHSHGGTIAAQALQDLDTAEKVTGFVSLSTPYLHITPIRERVNKDALLLIKLAGTTALLVFTTSVLGAWRDAGSFWPNLNSAFSWINHTTPVELLGLVVAGVIGTLLIGAIYIGIKGQASNFIKDACSPPVINESRVLILRAPGDEASSAIGAAGFLSWLSGKASETLMMGVGYLEEAWSRSTSASSKIVGGVKSFFSVACLYFICMVLSFVLVVNIEHDPTKWLNLGVLRFMIVAGTAAVMFALALVGFLMGIAVVLISVPRILASISTGWEFIFAGGNLIISAEAAPPGRWVVFHLNTRDMSLSDQPTRGAYRHSILYDSRATILLIARWMRDLL